MPIRVTDAEMQNKSVIIIQQPLGRLTLTADNVEKLYNEKKLIDSILLMLINNGETWENQFEVEFNREDAKKFLKDYFVSSTNYSATYIEQVLTKL